MKCISGNHDSVIFIDDAHIRYGTGYKVCLYCRLVLYNLYFAQLFIVHSEFVLLAYYRRQDLTLIFI